MADRTLKIEIVSNTRDAEQGMDRVEKKTDGMGQAFKNAAALAATWLAGKAVDAVLTFVDDSVRAFSDLNESLNALDVTFGDAAEGVKELGENAARNLGLSNAEFNQFAVSISAFAKEIAGDSGDVVGVVDQLTSRVSDFASVMNLEVSEAAEKFRSGLAGETEPLRKFGIDVSAATVEAFALANGIAVAGEEMTESQKVQARFGTIMEQTAQVQGDFARTADEFANAQRIANAEIENSKARAGEALVPFERLKTTLELMAAQTLGVFATQLGQLVGSIEAVDSHIQQFEIHMGQSADSAEAALTILHQYGGAVDELIPRLGLSREELVKLRDADEDFLRQMGFSEDQVRDLADVVENELVEADRDLEREARRAMRAVDRQTESQGDLEDQTEDTTEAIQEQFDTIRAEIDPLFKLRRATEDAAEAQEAVIKARDKFGRGSPEHLAAIAAASEANLDLEEAQIGARRSADLSREAFIKQQVEFGLTREEAELLADEFERLEGFRFSPKTITVHTRTTGGATVGSFFGAAGDRQHGGIDRATPGGKLVRVGEAGSDEATIPLNSEGARFMATTITEALKLMNGGGSGGGGGMTVNIHGSVVTEKQLIDAIHEGLLRKRRRNGGLGL